MKFGKGNGESTPRTGEVNGFFGEGIEVRGELRFNDTVRVDGKVAASVHSEGELILGPTGVLEGDIHVGVLSVSGRVKGTLHIAERLEIHPGGRIEGEVTLARPGLIVHDGGVLEASVQMGTAKQEKSREAAPKSAEKRVAVMTGAAGAV